ncbi:cell wall metabolism sensor histidine kinase WalK [Brevibacillus dissolubilis]|uniref:cell wall metabolism sensor histidine kinase WalK n=1 Tax=Brevibacillus dissolubilis TaxID=1844116 RepID=UPI001115CF84|nr:cell wall metabolism sensor histidine kinase WalK [Brevibacillus dissolubilis]
MFRQLFKTVQYKVVVIYMLLILIAMQVIGAYFVREVESYYTNNFTETLNAQGTLLATHLDRYLSRLRDREEDVQQDVQADIDNLVNNLVALNGASVEVVDQNGTVISTTENQKNIVGQRTQQKEVTVALLGTRNESLRIDPVTDHLVKVIAIPVKRGNVIYGAVYMVASMEGLYTTIHKVTNILYTGTVIALLLTAGLGIVLARTITIPVKEMTRQATAVAEGDFNRVVRVYSGDEIGQLGLAFNYMTARLKDAILQQEEEREKLSQILAHMSDGVIAADRDGRIILINRSAEEMLRIREADMLRQAKTLYEVLRLPPEDEMPLFSDTEETEPLLLEMMLPNREMVLLRVNFSPLPTDHGKKGGIIAVLQDVTEEARLEQQRREFVANVSHELRTPLTTIKSYTEALLDGAVEVPELSQQFLQVTMNETERMIRLVNDLLQLSRMDSQGVQLKLQQTNLAELLHYTESRFQMQSVQQGIQLHLVVPDDLPSLYLDRDAFTQIMDNLVSNAIKYTPEGGQIFIQAKAQKDQGRVYISVSDTGIGISKRDVRRIFERFFRVDKARSRNQGGTGLGLSIARELVRAHGGDIQLASELNEGTTVTFWIPYTEGGEA